MASKEMDLMSRKKVTLIYAKLHPHLRPHKENKEKQKENCCFKNKLYSLATPVKGVKYEI